MKKATLLIITMLLLTLSVAYAQVDLKPTVTGSAEVVWGMDLDTEGTGFTSSTSSSIALTLVSGSETKGADADVYGTITLGGFGISFSDTATIDLTDATIFKDKDGNTLSNIEVDIIDTTGATVDLAKLPDGKDQLNTGLNVTKPTITAKIVLSPTMSLIIASAPTLNYNWAAAIDEDIAVSHEYTTNGGVTLNVAAAPATINVIVLSAKNATDNIDQMYAFGADLSIKAGPATIGAYANMGIKYAANPIDVGAKVELDLGMIKPSLALDALIDTATMWDVKVSIPVAIAPITLGIDVSAASNGVANADMDADAKVSLGVTASGATISLAATIVDIIAAMGAKIEASVSYAAAPITVSTSVTYDLGVIDATTDQVFKLTVGVDAALIPNTVFTVKYVSDQLLTATPALGTAQDKGIITLGAKIRDRKSVV